MPTLSAQQWARRGYRIRTGARSYMRGAGGVALFSSNQVTPWDKPFPMTLRQAQNIVEQHRQHNARDTVIIGGELYRKVR